MKKSESLCQIFYGGGLCKERCRKAKREIIKKFVEVNDWYPEKELVDYVEVNKLCYNRSNFDRSYMDRFVSDDVNILEGPCKHLYCTNKELISYCLKKDIHTLRILVNCVYTKDNYPELFKSEYYLSMLDLVIDHLAKNAGLNGNFSLNSTERELLRFYFKYSYSGLKFCLSQNIDENHLNKFKKRAIDKIRLLNIGSIFAYLGALRITDSGQIDTSIFGDEVNISEDQLLMISEALKTGINNEINIQLRKFDQFIEEPPKEFIERYGLICMMENFIDEDVATGSIEKFSGFVADSEKAMISLGKLMYEYLND